MTEQIDLFLDQLVDAPIKDERNLMEFPFFSLQKRARLTPFVYQDDLVTIEVRPGDKGIATVWDKDVIIYIASLINERMERGAPVDRVVRFPAHDFLKVTGRGTGKRAYELFLDALHRLRSTTINTTLAAGGEVERRGFGWIDHWRVITKTNSKGQQVMQGVEVGLNDWMFRALVKDRRVLTINRDYFKLTMGLERRLYELARKHVGNQEDWWISLARLAQKCGTSREIRKFKADLNKVIARGSIPDYRMELVPAAEADTPFKSKDGHPLVHFVNMKREGTYDALEVPQVDIIEPLLNASITAWDEAKRRYPGYDIDFLEAEWRRWSEAKGAKIRNQDKAFLGFCATYVENNPI